MELSKKEKFEIQDWENGMYRDDLRNGYAVVIYDTPDEDRLSVAFANVYNAEELEQAWKAFCNDDPEAGIIHKVFWCDGVFGK